MAVMPPITVRVELAPDSYQTLLRLYHELGDVLMSLKPER